MNINFLKEGFKEYLESKGALSARDILRENNDVSIFMHAAEFKEYLAQEYSVDANFGTKSLSDILSMEVVNGKIVDPNAPENKENQELLQAIEDEKEVQQKEIDEAQEAEADEALGDDVDAMTDVDETDGAEALDEAEEEGEISKDATDDYAKENGVNIEDPEIVTAILNDLLNDATFKEAIDKDGDGEIGKEDLAAFYDIIKCYDNDENTISLEDILGAVEDINNGVFRYATDEEVKEKTGDDPKVEVPETTQAAPSCSGSGGTGGASGVSGGGGSTAPQEVKKYDENGNAILDNFTVEELKQELTKANEDLTTKENALKEIQNGEDSELKDLQDQIDKANEEYLEAVKEQDEDLSTKIDDKQKEINDKKDEISKKDVEITDAESALSKAELNYNNLTSQRQALESQLSTLNSAKSDSKDEDISNKINALESRISEVKKQEEAAKTAKEEAKTALDNKKAEKKELEEQLGTLDDDMKALEDQVSPEIKEKYLEPLKDLQKQYDDKKAEKIKTAQEDVTKAQEYVSKVQAQLSAKETADEISEKYSVNDAKKLLEYAYSFKGMSESQVESILGYGLPDGLWCAAYCHAMLKNTYGELPSWYENCNYNGCGSILNAAQQNGAAFTDYNQAKPGDLVIFKTNRSATGHVGIVSRIENGKLYTIEGNTSSRCDERCYDVNDSSRINSYVRVV